MAGGRNGARSDGLIALEKDRVGDTAHVPDLCKDQTAGSVYGGRNRLPCSHLLLAPDARNLGIADALRRHRNAFRNDEPGTRALTVVVSNDRGWNVVRSSAQTCQRSHDDAIRQQKIAEA